MHIWCSIRVILLKSCRLGAGAAHAVPRSGVNDYLLEAGRGSAAPVRTACFLRPLFHCRRSALPEHLELLHQTRHLGISHRRGEWLIKWARATARAEFVHPARFEEGLGRFMYVVGALELERPFLGPLYRFMTIQARGSIPAGSILCQVRPSFLG